MVLALAQYAPQGWTLGLGEFVHESYLGQPLKGIIGVVAQGEFFTADEIKVRLVQAEEAKSLGFDVGYQPVRFDFVPQGKGSNLRVKVSSRGKIDEPYLNIVVELQWPGGVIYREYVFLLDLP